MHVCLCLCFGLQMIRSFQAETREPQIVNMYGRVGFQRFMGLFSLLVLLIALLWLCFWITSLRVCVLFPSKKPKRLNKLKRKRKHVESVILYVFRIMVVLYVSCFCKWLWFGMEWVLLIFKMMFWMSVMSSKFTCFCCYFAGLSSQSFQDPVLQNYGPNKLLQSNHYLVWFSAYLERK